MKHTYFPLAAVALLAGWMTLSCNFKKIELDPALCHEATQIDCSSAGGRYALDASCTEGMLDSVRWQVSGDPVVLTGERVEYTFTDQSKMYTVTLSATVDGKALLDTFTVDASDTHTLSFEKKLDQLDDSQFAQDIAVLPDGSYAICGINKGAKTMGFVTRTKTNGDILWHQTFEPPGAFETNAYSIVANDDGSMVVAGTAIIFVDTVMTYQGFVVKIGASGVVGPTVPMHDASMMEGTKAFAIDRYRNGGYLVGGHIFDGNPAVFGEGNIWEINSSLAHVASKPMGNEGIHQVRWAGGTAFLAVGSQDLPYGFDAQGNPFGPFNPVFHVSSWKNLSTFNWGFAPTPVPNPTEELVRGFAAIQLTNGTVAACGDYQQALTKKRTVRLIKYTTTGFGTIVPVNSEAASASDLTEAHGSNSDAVVLACTANDGDPTNTGDDNFLVMQVKLPTNQVLWKKSIARAGSRNNAVAIARTPDCGYIVAGQTTEGETGGGTSTFLVRIDQKGN